MGDHGFAILNDDHHYQDKYSIRLAFAIGLLGCCL